MVSANLEDYLADEEELLLSFTAIDVTRGDGDDNEQSFAEMVENHSSNSEYKFGATDRRIVYLEDSGDFKDIDYQHISSIESSVEEEEDLDPRVMIGCCGGFLLLGGFSAISSDPGVAILLFLVGAGLIAGAVYTDHEGEASEKQKMKFITGDEIHQQIEVTLSSNAEANIGAELSRILREQR